MGKALLNEQEFSRVIVTRARRERPDIRVQAMGKFMLLVEPERGRKRLVSLVDLYQTYCESPVDRDGVISDFLSALVYDEDREAIEGSFVQNRDKILPQVVPPSLLEYCRRENRELAAWEFVADLAITFVVDEPDRYSYIHRRVTERWNVGEVDLLKAALENLQALHQDGAPHHRIGKGEQLTMVWETFDGYDASRVLLTQELTDAATLVVGNPVIAIPHRDYMVMFGDASPAFVAEMTDRIRQDFEAHHYPITARLFTLADGVLMPYQGADRHRRVLN